MATNKSFIVLLGLTLLVATLATEVSFTPNKCPVNSPDQPRCAFFITPGCAGYKNGTYKYISTGNRCTYCYDSNTDLVSFNENEKCPVLSSPIPAPTQPGKTFVPNKCPLNTNGTVVRCAGKIVPGCACYANETCEYLTNGNRCTQCYTTNSKVVSFNENEKCHTLSFGNGNESSSGVQLGLKFRFQAGVLHF